MSIQIKTYVSIDTNPMISKTAAVKSKKGAFYPDKLSLVVRVANEYIDNDGEPATREDKYTIFITGSSKSEGVTSPEIGELNRLLRAYDYVKYPLQLETEPFDPEGTYVQDVGRFINVDRNAREAVAITTAADLLKKVKEPNKK